MSAQIIIDSWNQVLDVQGSNRYEAATAIAYGTIVIAMIAALLSIVLSTIRNGISPMPSSPAARHTVAREIERLVHAGVLSEHDTIIEAGSGWGHLAFHLARRFPQLSIVGMENSPLPLITSRLWRMQTIYANVRLSHSDLFRADYSEAKLIICYLYPGAMQCLQRAVMEGLKLKASNECWLISVGFAIPNMTPVRTSISRDMYRTPVYLYLLSI